MKKITILVMLLFCMNVFSDEIIFNSGGEKILLKNDFTWEYLKKADNEINQPNREINYNGIIITVEEAQYINTYSGLKVGIRFRIQNNSDKTVNKLKITVYFINLEGLTFFENTYLVVNSDAYSNPPILKPNYTIVSPADYNDYHTAEGIAMDLWDRGKVWIEVSEIEYEDE